MVTCPTPVAVIWLKRSSSVDVSCLERQRIPALDAMSSFARARLEGRALEDAFSGKRKRGGVRMYDDRQATWVTVTTEVAQLAEAAMRLRAKAVRAELASVGLLVQAADQFATVDGDRFSIDLRCWHQERQGQALLEVKWSRQSLAVALKSGKLKLPVFRRASTTGRWVRSDGKSGGRIKASLVGVLAVGPDGWECLLEAASGRWTQSLTAQQAQAAPEKKRKSGASGWAAWRAGSSPGDPRWPSGPSGKSNWRRCGGKRPDSATSWELVFAPGSKYRSHPPPAPPPPGVGVQGYLPSPPPPRERICGRPQASPRKDM
jgi:hypothetical protein